MCPCQGGSLNGYHDLVRLKMNEAVSQGARFSAGASERIGREYSKHADELGIIDRLKLLQALITVERTDGGNA